MTIDAAGKLLTISSDSTLVTELYPAIKECQDIESLLDILENYSMSISDLSQRRWFQRLIPQYIEILCSPEDDFAQLVIDIYNDINSIGY